MSDMCDVCAICQDGEELLTDYTRLACGHRFHSTCIAKWLWQTKGNMSCPCCRTTPPSDSDSESNVSSDTDLAAHNEHMNIRRQRRLDNSRRLRNMMRRKFNGRRECNKQKRYRDLGTRITELRKDARSFSKSIYDTSQDYKQKVRALSAEWKHKRRSLYFDEKADNKEVRKKLSKVKTQLVRARMARRKIATALLALDDS